MHFSSKPLRLQTRSISIAGKKFLESHTVQRGSDAEICCNKGWTYRRVLAACFGITVTLHTVMKQNCHTTVGSSSNWATVGGREDDKETAKLLTSGKFPELLYSMEGHTDQTPPLPKISDLDKTQGKCEMSPYLLPCKRAEVTCSLNAPNGTLWPFFTILARVVVYSYNWTQ